MRWELFIARKSYGSQEGGQKVSKPAVRIAIAGIAVGLAIMIVSVAVVVGFKRQVRNQVTGVSADVLLTNFDRQQSYETMPILANDSLCNLWQSQYGVAHVQRYTTKPGMIKTDTDFVGIVLKGIADEYDLTFLQSHLEEGEWPAFSDSVSTNEIVVSRSIANKLKLHLDDKVYTYFITDNQVRARRFTVKAIFQTHLTSFDNLFMLTDLHTLTRLNNWADGEVSGVEIQTLPNIQTEEVRAQLADLLAMDPEYYVRTVEEANPGIFSWLNLLDLNVWVILILMLGVAGFTIIAGLLIIILERTQMIGTLKALGACNRSVRFIFMGFAVMIIARGMLWGNVAGLLLCFVQQWFHLFQLDPGVYYIDHVPIELRWWHWLLLNVGTMLASVAMLIGPSHLIARIHPAKSIRFE